MFDSMKYTLLQIKANLQENSLDSLLWLVDIVPRRAGYSIIEGKFHAPFWIVHLTLLVYVYVVGIGVYQVKYAHGAGDFIKSYLSVSILLLTLNCTYWFLKERVRIAEYTRSLDAVNLRLSSNRTMLMLSLLRTVLMLVKKSDELSKETVTLRGKHVKRISVIKKILLVFCGFNLFDAFVVYLPHRINVTNIYFAVAPCVGLEPLNVAPNRQICISILIIQELTIMTVILTYQAIILFLIAHTTVMYQMLSEEIKMFGDQEKLLNIDVHVKERLPVLIKRHALILEIVKGLKALYSMPLGVNFGSNAVCICLFYYLPLQEWIQYSPILIYCFLVFFLYCFLCQRLINAAEAFERDVYSCGWEYFKVKDQKSIYVMLIQAQKPVVLLAADIIPVNIYTFATTLQAMFKFVTVVKF